jgi:hypothetical protein
MGWWIVAFSSGYRFFAGWGGLPLLNFDPEKQGCRIGLAHPWDATCLTQGCGLNGAQLFSGFFG